MNYTYLKVFYTVVKHLNISDAAKELDVTQPAVSRIISTMEKEFNTKLFFRSKGGVSLTREGLNLFEMIKNPLSELEKVEKDIKLDLNLSKITVHIGATATALNCYLFKQLEQIKSKFPHVNFRIYTNSSANLLNMVMKGTIDFAFITTPFKSDEEIEIDNVYTLNNVLVAPISYKDKIKGRVSIKSLTKYPFIFLSKEMQFREHIDAYLKNHNVDINPAYETDTSNTLISFVENDCGLTFIPDEMANEAIKENRCFKVDLIEDVPLRYISFAIKKDKNHAKVIYDIKDAILNNN